MTAFLAWVAFPLVALLVTLGLGLLVDAFVGRQLPGPLVLPVGFALLIGLTQLTTWSGSLAPVTPFVVAAAAVGGLVLGRRELRRRPIDRWAAATGGAVFLVYLAPVMMSGHPGFAGYALLGDTSIHLELAERMIHHGASVAGLVPSSFSVSLDSYFATSYPTGAHTAFAALGEFVPVDLAWLYQPYLSSMMALAALAAYQLAEPLVPSRPWRAVVAFVAAQPGLVFAFAMQGAIKELATIATLATVFALLPWVVGRDGTARRAVPVAIAAAGALGAIDIAAVAWLGPGLLAALAVLVWTRRRRGLRTVGGHVAVFAGVGAILCLPTLTSTSRFVEKAKTVLTSQVELGDLSGPLDNYQVFGVWPQGDFRLPLDRPELYVLIGVVILGLAFGILRLLRGRGWALLAFAVASTIAWWYVTRTGSPWADAKALAILSPAVVLVAAAGAASIAAFGQRLEAGLLLGVIAGGVLWTNALAYHNVSVSNWPRLRELEQIGEDYAGQGPTFTPEFEEFDKYFLRDAIPVAGSEAWKPGPSGLIPGGLLRFGFSTELGQFSAAYVNGFRTVVVRRSPVQSRPPATFRLVRRGAFYDVWQRDPGDTREIVAELPLGDRYRRGARPSCGDLEAFARQATEVGGWLAAAPAPDLVVATPETSGHSPGWGPDGADGSTYRATGPGWIQMLIRVKRAGRYDAWTEASLPRPLTLLVDGQRVGTVPAGLSGRGPGEGVHVASVTLRQGESVVRLERPGGSLYPGDGSGATLLGPTTFAPAGSDPGPVDVVAPRDWRSLCGQTLDWVEIVR